MIGGAAWKGSPERAGPPPSPPTCVFDLVRLIGPELTLALVEHRGGTRVHIPKPAGVATSYLFDLLGEKPLLALAKEHGGCALNVPLCKNWRVRVMLHLGGRSQAESARLIGVTEQYVRRQSPAGRQRMPTTHKMGRAASSSVALSHDLSDASAMLGDLA